MKPLPNVRKLFMPDKGHILLDCDLSGADAQVVAWEANDNDLKQAFQNGLDIHDHNGKSLWGDAYQRDATPRKYTMRDELKRAVHGTNYAAGLRTLSATLGWTQQAVGSFQNAWFRLHPGIREWHRRVERDLQTQRRVQNKFGYRIIYFDRPQNLLPKGLAWIPQSTVAIVCARGAQQLYKHIPWATILLQVHDSLVFQIPVHRDNSASYRELRNSLRVAIPYDDELIIPWGLALSSKSWGDVEKKSWSEVT